MSYSILKLIVLLLACGVGISGLLDWEVDENENCDTIQCSNYEDPVCGFRQKWYSNFKILSKFHNRCHLKRHFCYETREIWIPTSCEPFGSRRQADFTITGANSVICNHSCPITCPEIYDPVCMRVDNKFVAIVNHCSVDLYSCTSGKNVSLAHLYMCNTKRPWVSFALTAKTMNNLQLLKPKKVKEGLTQFQPKENIYSGTPMMILRRSFLWTPGRERGEEIAHVDGEKRKNEGWEWDQRDPRREYKNDAKDIILFPALSEAN